MMPTTRRKPTFQELRLAHQISIQQIADQAQVPFKEVYLNEAILTYPPSTTRQELYPRTSDIRYRILLADGVEMREIDTRRPGLLIHLQVVVDERTAPELERYLEQVAGL